MQAFKVVLKASMPKTDAHLPSVSHICAMNCTTKIRTPHLFPMIGKVLYAKDYKEPDFYRGMRVPY